jgi:hypothetical protein
MSVIRDNELAAAWGSAITLTTDTFLQCHEGRVAVTDETTPDADDGAIIFPVIGISFVAGQVLRLRKVGTDAAKVTLTRIGL